METQNRQFDYKWVILVLCFLMEFVCLGFCSSNPGLYTDAVVTALNTQRSIYSLSTSIRYAVQVLVALSFGTMISKFGVRKMVCIGLAGLTGSVFIRACATNVLHIYISSAFWGLGIVFCGGTMASTIVRRWFHKDIGRYTGIVMSANGIGGAIAAQIISPLINNGEIYGYRKAYLLSAILSLCISIVVVTLLREHPTDGPAMQTAGGKKKPKGITWAGLEYSAIKRKPYFYGVAALVLLTGISLQSVGNITIVYMKDIGMNADFIAATSTVFSLCLTFSKFLVGITYDKKGLRTALMMCQIATLLCFLMFALLTNSTLGMVMAMAAMILQALALPLETVMIPLISNDLFGATSYDKVLGVLFAMNSLGLCLGSPIGELFRELSKAGTYVPCFWFFSVLICCVIIGYIFVIRAANRDKMAILSQ